MENCHYIGQLRSLKFSTVLHEYNYMVYLSSVRSRWLDIGQVLFLRVLYGLVEVCKHAKKRPISSHLD